MKRMFGVLLIVFGLVPRLALAQTDEAAQLLLNVEKLSQLKNILVDLKKSYKILHDGFTLVSNISQGNFSIHKVFLDGLMEVSPAVKKYRKVAGIVEYQVQLVQEYKKAYNRFRQMNAFTAKELEYLSNVYGNLLKLSLRNLDELITVVTAGELRMSDDERLAAVDRIFAEMEDKLLFLRDFNGKAAVFGLQRSREIADMAVSEKIGGYK